MSQMVLMYHPLLPETQLPLGKPARVALRAVDDWAAVGWLLVDPDVTPPAPSTPWYPRAEADAKFLTEDTAREAFDEWPGKSGMELGFAEIRTGVNAPTTTTPNVTQDLAPYGLQLVIDPSDRPYLVRGLGIVAHSVAGGVVGMRITEVSNGVDPVLARVFFTPVPDGGAAPAGRYAWCRPKLRVPPSPRTRTFKLGWLITTAGTGTFYVAGTDMSAVVSNGTYACEIQAVTL